MESDSIETTTQAIEQTEKPDQVDQTQPEKAEPIQITPSAPSSTPPIGVSGFDVMALDIVIAIALFFAVLAHLNRQPSNSLAPVVILSATGCGLLITALRKRRTMQRPGLLEASLGGFVLALFQFLTAITYPGVLNTLSTDEGQRLGFLTTWGLIAGFSILFAVAGAALGHLAFAPLRPLPARQNTTASPTPPSTSPVRSFVNNLISVLLLGLAPTLVGFVFAAAFDYMLSIYQLTPGPYPTLRLLSALLPWQIPISIDLSGGNLSLIILLLWRIPVFVGNPAMFDLQALEPLVFNGAALGLLLLTMNRREASDSAIPLSWLTYLGLEVALGLFLMLPADLWLLGGVRGLLQIPRLDIVAPIPTLHILDQRTFMLNLITGPLICLGVGVVMREWNQWSRRRTKRS